MAWDDLSDQERASYRVDLYTAIIVSCVLGAIAVVWYCVMND